MKITAVVGSYRKGGIIDSAVDEILSAASEEGAEVEKIHLSDRHIEFCTNCRACMQQEGPERGECCLHDDMNDILDAIECSDAIILASPMNFGTVTAIMKRFIERLTCFGYWPWGRGAPVERRKPGGKRAVLVASSAAPAFIARLMSHLVKLLEQAAGLLGARTVGVLFIGLAAKEPGQALSEKVRKRARKLGKKLVAVC